MKHMRHLLNCAAAVVLFQMLVPDSYAYSTVPDVVRLPDVSQDPRDSLVHRREVGAVSPASWNLSGSDQFEYPESRPLLKSDKAVWQIEACARGYYLNDQRIQWSGVEETFGAEAAIAPRVEQSFGSWETGVEGEFYVNQPFDRNILVETAEQVSYRGNFEIPTFEVSQLYLSAGRDGFSFSLGKFPTPFGRTYFPLYTNSRLDAPFIRTECIIWRETGALIHFQRECFVADAAITNGCEQGDTNSSKALVSRLGLDSESWACGFSVKVHDGIGSEGQKQYKNHIGMDSMLQLGRVTFSGEAIYDEYGFRRPGFDPLEITWGRSIYYRDQHYRLNTPITGFGYYLDLLYDVEPFCVSCNFGEYYPQQLGIPQHDVTQRRGIVKGAYAVTPQLQFYLGCLLENGGYIAQLNRPRQAWVVLTGMQWTL